MQNNRADIENISRLKLLLNALEVTQKEMATAIGVSESILSSNARGDKPLTANTALKISSKYPKVNFKWLMSGEGEMLKQPQPRGNAGENMVEMLDYDLVRESEELAKDDARRALNESTEPEMVRLKRENEKLRDYNLRLTEQVARLAELVGMKIDN